MAGSFEVFLDADSRLRFRLMAPDGTEVAVSGVFEDKSAVAAGIFAVRECAGTGLVTDLCPSANVSPPTVAASSNPQPTCADPRIPAPRMHAVMATAQRRTMAASH